MQAVMQSPRIKLDRCGVGVLVGTFLGPFIQVAVVFARARVNFCEKLSRPKIEFFKNFVFWIAGVKAGKMIVAITERIAV